MATRVRVTCRRVTQLALTLTVLLPALFVATDPAPASATSTSAVPASAAPATAPAETPIGGHVVAPAGGVPLAADYHPLVPARLLDTRSGVAVGAGASIVVDVTGVGGVPASGVGAVVLNVTATRPSDAGFLTVWPSGGSRPLASNLNFAAGETIANTVVAKVGADGSVSVFNSDGATDVIVDVEGWFADTGPAGQVFEGDQYGWRFVPSNMLLAPGETRRGTMVQTDLSGAPTGGALPQGTTFEMSGLAGNVTVRSIGGTAIEVTAGTQIDTAIVAAKIPLTAVAPVMTVTVARLKPGVATIDDEDIAFPDPTLPADFGTGDVLPADTTSSGVGPFTWDEIKARLLAPDGSFNGLDEAGVLATVVRYPVVLHGAPPATGTVVVGSGGSALIGRVVEPAGLPTLVSGAFSLVSVELVGPQDVYQDLHYDLHYDDLVDLGAAPEVDSVVPPAPELPAGPSRITHSSVPAADPPTPDPTTPDPNNQTVAGPGTVQSGGGGTSKLRECVDKMLAAPQAGFASAEFSPAISLDFTPTLNAYVQINDGRLKGARLELGGSITVTVAAKVKFQPSGNFTLDCKMANFLQVEMVAPGPLAPFLSITGDVEQHFKLSVTIAGGPKAEPGISCSAKASVVVGFNYDAQSGNVDDLGSADIQKPACNADPKPSVNDGTSGVGVSLELTIGAPIVAPMGVRIGGKIMQGIGKVLAYFNLTGDTVGKVKGFQAEVTPQLRFTIENETNAMTNENAKGAAIAEVVGKATVEIEPITWLLKIFSIGTSGSAFSLTLYQETLPLLNGYQALNAVDGGIVAKAGSDTIATSPAVYVQKDDQFVLTSALAPSGGGGSTSFSIPELESAKVFEKASDGYLTESTQFDVSVIQSTGAQSAYGKTTIKVSKTISQSMCDALRDEPHTYVMVGDAPIHLFGFTLPMPAWGGSFKLQCVEGKIEWSPAQVDPLDFDDGATVQIKTHGPHDDTWTITGKPDWMAVSPTTGDLTGGTEADAESIDVEISTSTPGSVDCWEPRSATLTVSTEHRGAADLPVKEEDPCYLKFQPATVTGPHTVTATLLTKGRTTDGALVPTDGLPDWLHVTSPTGVITMPSNDGEEQSIPFEFQIDERAPKCTVQLPRTYDFTVHTSTRGDATLHIIDPKVDAREDCGLRFTPNALVDSGHSKMTLRDDDLDVDETADWEIDPATVPEWLNVVPMSGTIESDVQLQVNFAQLGTPFDRCVGRPQRSATVSAKAYVPTGLLSTKTVTGQIKITRPAIPPADCPVTTGAAEGDPHMTSLDGVRFEGQILGEYVYTRTVAGAADPLELVVRTQPTSGTTSPVAPTSVTAIAVVYGGSKVEAYAAGGTIDVLVDGEAVTLAADVPLPVADGLSITRSGTAVRIDAPAFTVRADLMYWVSNLLNIRVSAAIGSPLEGLLGSPNGDPSDDFVGADGTHYTVAQIQGNEPPAFYDYVDSWRLHNQADSPFTRSYPQFNAPNPGFNQAILDEFGDDVDAKLVGSDKICDGSITAQQRYGLALELSFGADADVQRFLCSYVVSGVATADGESVAGLRVTADAPGLQPCVSTTGVDGRYFCALTPDLAEAQAASESLFPLTVDVVGRWPGLGSTAASGAATFTSKSSLNHGPQRAEVALSVDPNSLPRVLVSGSMFRDGVPLAGTTLVSAAAYDAAGSVLLWWNQVVDVSINDGSYQFTRVLPPTATRVVLWTNVSSPVSETFSTEATGLVLGPNPVRFDVSYTVPTATVSGTLTDGSAGLVGHFGIGVVAKSPTGAVLATPYTVVAPDPVTGAYTFDVPLPRATATVEAVVQLGLYGETFRSATVAIVDHHANVGLSAVYAPSTVAVSGDYLNELGLPIGTQSQLGVWFFDANGAFITSRGAYVPATAGAGSYSVSFTAPLGATQAEAFVNAGVQGESFRSARVPMTNLTQIDLDVVLNPVRLHVTGTMTDGNGTPLTGTVPMDIQFKDASGMVVTGQVGSVVPDSVTGAYAIDFVGPRSATSAIVRALVGVNGEPRSADVPNLTNGSNDFVFNVGFSPPVVTFTGRITGVGGAPLASPIAMHVQGHDDHYFTQFSQTRYVTLDAEGDYSFTAVMPSSVVTVSNELQIGSAVEWYHTGDVPVQPGNNTVVLDADYRPPSATVSGVLVSAPGVPLGPPFVPGAISIGVSARNANGDTIRYTQPAITPGAGGAYSFPVSLPRGTVSVEVRAFISGQDIAQVFGGFADGVHQDIPFDVAYNPPRLNLSGIAKRDGVVATGQVRVDIRRYSAPTVWTDSTQYLAIGAGGAYSRNDVLLPPGTIKADVTVQLSDGSHSFSSAVDSLVPGDVRSVVIDFDDVQTSVTVSGTLRLLGEAAEPGNMYISAYDSNNAALTVGQPWRFVTPGADGSFSDVRFVVPPNTAWVVVYSFLTTPGWSDSMYATQSLSGIVASTDNPLEWHVDGIGVHVTGSLVDDGNRVTLNDDSSDIEFNVDRHEPTGGVSSGATAVYEVDNTFALDLLVPADTTSVDLTITNAGLTSPTTTIESFTEPVTYYQWLADLHPAGNLTFLLFGALTDGGVPVTTQPALTFEVVGYAYSDWDHPYQEVWRRQFTTPILPDGHYGVGWNDVPPSVTLIRATVKVNGADDGWSRGYTDFTISDTNQRTFDIDVGASRMRYGGNVVLDQCTGPLVFYREFWTFTSPPTEQYDWDTNTWPGGTLAGRVLVIPDTTAPYEQDTAVHMAPDTAWVGTVFYDHNSGGTGGGSFPPAAFAGTMADETAHC